MPGPCDGCGSEEECRRCLINQGAPALDSILGEGTSPGEIDTIESVINTARDKHVLTPAVAAELKGKMAVARANLVSIRYNLYHALGGD